MIVNINNFCYFFKMKKFKDTEYYVTEDGKVYSNKLGEMKEMKLNINKTTGYLQVSLSINKKRKTYLVHRLVGEVYLLNPDNLPLVEHKDDIKINNHVSNLMWSSYTNNNKNAYKTGLKKPIETKGEKNGNSKLTKEQVKWIRENYIPKHPQFGGTALSKKFGLNKFGVSGIINNKTWKHI
jgi:hypothetical protein